MGWFSRKTPEQQAKENLIEEKAEKFEQKFENLSLFKGDLSEYERFVRYECEIIDTGRKEKFIEWWDDEVPLVNYEHSFQKRMYEEGIEALVHYSISAKYGPQYLHTGVPVKKRNR